MIQGCGRRCRHTALFSVADIVILALLFIHFFSSPLSAAESTVKIGVLAKRGPQQCLNQWTPTADYLSRSINGCRFAIVPLGFDDVYDAVKTGKVDFVLVNSSFYVELETWYGVNRIATLKNLRSEGAYTVFGGVIISRADRTDIKKPADLEGKIFMAVDPTSFGGWRAVWRELAEQGIDPEKDFRSLTFGGTHDAVVNAVKDGYADAGSVRSDTLERMEEEGLVLKSDFKVIHPVDGGRRFPFLLSTRLYPEWPMAKVRHTDDDLAKYVAAAMMEMDPESYAAMSAKSAGWTIPANYQPVHECLKALKVGPYEHLGRITPIQLIKQYWMEAVLIGILILLLSFSTAVFYRLGRKVRVTNIKLADEVETRRQAENEKETVIHELQSALAEVKTLRGFLPICSNCKKIRNDDGYWLRVEQYIEERSDAKFSHGLCPECIKILYPEFADSEADESSVRKSHKK